MLRSFFACRRHPASLLLCGLLWCLPAAAGPASGENAPSTDGNGSPALTLAAALEFAEQHHPVLQTLPARRAAAAALVDEARFRPAPELAVAVEDIVGGGAYRGLRSAETTLSISQLFEGGDLRDARVEVAMAGHRATSADDQILRLNIHADIAQFFVEVIAEQERLALRQEAVALAAGTLSEIERRLASGRGTEADRRRALIALEQSRLDAAQSESQLRRLHHRLAGAIGQPARPVARVAGALDPLPAALPLPVLEESLASAPEALRFTNEMRLRQSEIRLAEGRRRPAVTLGSGLRHNEAGNDFGLVFSFSVPLGSGQRATPAIARARAELQLSESAATLALLRAQTELHQLYEQLSHAQLELDAIAEVIVPSARAALDEISRLYQSGRYGLFELRDAQREWLAQRERRINVAAAYHACLIEIQRLTGAAAVDAPKVDILR